MSPRVAADIQDRHCVGSASEDFIAVNERSHCVWGFTRHESEQGVFSHGVFTTETVPVRKHKRLVLVCSVGVAQQLTLICSPEAQERRARAATTEFPVRSPPAQAVLPLVLSHRWWPPKATAL